MSSPAVPAVEHASLREQVRRILRTSIVTGELEPGSLYSVGSFAEQLGVSATPVREALGDLAHVGLVEMMRNRGFVVPELTDRDLDEILQLRLFLEVPAIEQVTGHVPADVIAACRERAAQTRMAAAAGDLVLFLDADRDLHLRLVGVLGNGRLVDVLAQLRDQTRLFGLRELAAAGRLDASAQEHETLLDAVEAGDRPRARVEIERHLRHTRGSWAGNLEP
ncbi:MAG: GntR family transcriptional regulator [Gaiellaceae bacterium]